MRDQEAAEVATAAQQLEASGVDAPQDEARRLWRWAIAQQPLRPGQDTRVLYRRAVAERAARRPFSQIIGSRAFWRHDFAVTPDVLDPRPESETLVEAALAAVSPATEGWALDLGAGSGCLLLSVIAERLRLRGVGLDASPAALAVAAENAALLGLEDRCDWLEANFFDRDWPRRLPAQASAEFDLILCNPPYIDRTEWATLAPEVRLYEPKAALTPGMDGLAAYRALAAVTLSLLRPQGLAVFEVGHRQADAAAALFVAAGGVVERACDLGGVERALIVRPGSNSNPSLGLSSSSPKV